MEDQHVYEIAAFLIAQLIVIVGAIVTTYVRIAVSIAKIQLQVDGVLDKTSQLKVDHYHLAGQVGGISRGLARLEGHVGATKVDDG